MSTTILRDEATQQFSQLLELPVRELAEALAAATRNYQNHQPHDDLVGLALFTLAIAHHNQEAWTCLYRQYRPLVISWVMQHPDVRQLVARDDGDAAPLMNGAFAKFFQAVTPAKLQDFHSLGALLRYLHLCTSSVVIDEVRRHRARHAEQQALDEIEQEPTEDHLTDGVLATIGAQQLWQIIRDELHNDEEFQLVYQIYFLGMKPGEVSRQAPRLFPTVDDVHRAKRNALACLRRSPRLRSVAGEL